MLSEHDEGRQYIRALRAAAERWRAGDENARLLVTENALRYVTLLRQHILKGNYSGCHCEGIFCPKQSRVEQEKPCFGRLLHSQKALVRSDTPVSSGWLNSYLEGKQHPVSPGCPGNSGAAAR